jgi:hypothetical protein
MRPAGAARLIAVEIRRVSLRRTRQLCRTRFRLTMARSFGAITGDICPQRTRAHRPRIERRPERRHAAHAEWSTRRRGMDGRTGGKASRGLPDAGSPIRLRRTRVQAVSQTGAMFGRKRCLRFQAGCPARLGPYNQTALRGSLIAGRGRTEYRRFGRTRLGPRCLRRRSFVFGHRTSPEQQCAPQCQGSSNCRVERDALNHHGSSFGRLRGVFPAEKRLRAR